MLVLYTTGFIYYIIKPLDDAKPRRVYKSERSSQDSTWQRPLGLSYWLGAGHGSKFGRLKRGLGG